MSESTVTGQGGPENQSPHWTILGCGEMGTAIAEALRNSGTGRERLLLIQRNPDKRQALRAAGFRVAHELSVADANITDILILAVKPRDIPGVISAARTHLAARTWVISVAAGVTYQRLRALLPEQQPLFRLRPSIFVRQRRGNLLLMQNPTGVTADFLRLRELLGAIGRVFVLPEAMMEQSTWESSSIPAIIIPAILQGFTQAAPAAHAGDVAAMMLAGLDSLSAYLKDQQAAGISPARALDELCEAVVTPGGINDAAMQYLEKNRFHSLLREAKNVYCAAEEQLKKELSAGEPLTAPPLTGETA